MEVKVIDGENPESIWKIKIGKFDLIRRINSKINEYSNTRENHFLIFKNIILRDDYLISFYKICPNDQIWSGKIENYFKCDNIVVCVFMVSRHSEKFIHLIVSDRTRIAQIISILGGILPNDCKIINLWNYLGGTMTNDQLVKDLATNKGERLIIWKLDNDDIDKSFDECCDIYDQNLVNELWTIRPILPRFDLTTTINEKMQYLEEIVLSEAGKNEQINDDFWSKIRCLKHSRFLCCMSIANHICFILFEKCRSIIREKYQQRYQEWVVDMFDQFENHFYLAICVAVLNFIDEAHGSHRYLSMCRSQSQPYAVKCLMYYFILVRNRFFRNLTDNRRSSWKLLNLFFLKNRDYDWIKKVSPVIDNTNKQYIILPIIGFNEILVNTSETMTTVQQFRRAISSQTSEPSERILLIDNECEIQLKDEDLFDRNNMERYICQFIQSMDDIKILSQISRGSFGKTFLCKNNITKDQFVLKIPLKLGDLNREIRIHSILDGNSYNIFRHRGLFNYEGTVCSATDYKPGGTLDKFIKKQKYIQEPEIARISLQVLLQIKEMHKRGVIHRDIKPDNIVLDENKNVYLIDFGNSKHVNSTVFGESLEILTKSAHGNVHYMAPELASGSRVTDPVTEKIDTWSFGVMVIEMVNGQRPHHNVKDCVVIMKLHRQEKIIFEPSKSVSKELEDFINSCLECDPIKRASIDNLIRSNFIRRNCDEIK